MWQRIQSIFLFFVAVSMILMLFFPIWVKANTTTGESYVLTAINLKHVLPDGEANLEYFPYVFIGVLAVIAAAIAVYEIFRYDNRLTQMKLGALNSLIMSITLGLSVFFLIQAEKEWIPTVRAEYQLGLFLPVIAMILNTLANRFIRKDEKLVRSVDRIR